MELGPVFDALLCLALLWVAWRTVTTQGLFASSVLFMIFGLLMATAWARLGAPDVALAEAAIGAGITGALLLGACKAKLSEAGALRARPAAPRPAMPRPLAGALSVVVGGVLAWLTIAVRDAPTPVSTAAAAEAADHFLGNPVSMVLLDLRAHDTLMEMLVLLLACVASRALAWRSGLPPPFTADSGQQAGAPLVMIMTPFLMAVALYLLWAGGHAPGGAFQAGALLAALGIMYQLTGGLQATDHTSAAVRALLVIGLLAFSLLAWLGLAWAGVPFGYPARGGAALALVIELAMMLSIAVGLVLLFTARPGLRLKKRP